MMKQRRQQNDQINAFSNIFDFFLFMINVIQTMNK